MLTPQERAQREHDRKESLSTTEVREEIAELKGAILYTKNFIQEHNVDKDTRKIFSDSMEENRYNISRLQRVLERRGLEK